MEMKTWLSATALELKMQRNGKGKEAKKSYGAKKAKELKRYVTEKLWTFEDCVELKELRT
jgi:hypothetical protein